MIDNRLEKVFKMFELKEYSHLFTIPYPDICVHYIRQIAVNFPVFTLGTHTLGTSVGMDMESIKESLRKILFSSEFIANAMENFVKSFFSL